MTDRVFVYADWSQLESWLTAIFSHDPTLLGELEAYAAGRGPKVHAVNAALLFDKAGVTVDNSKKVLINHQGRPTPAYEAGKRISHGFDYGMGAGHMAKTFWITLKEAEEHVRALSDKYKGVVAHRQELVDEVFGVFEYTCPRCGYTRNKWGTCPTCSTRTRRVPLTFSRVIREADRCHYTQFGRRRLYLGRRKEGANPLAAQDPQSGGASMWFITLLRLHGYDVMDPETPWQIPPDALRWNPQEMTYANLYQPTTTFISTGTYDSFLAETSSEEAPRVLEWLLWTMEQPWPQLGGRRVPAEGAIGGNWNDQSEENPNGLVGAEHRFFTAKNPYV